MARPHFRTRDVATRRIVCRGYAVLLVDVQGVPAGTEVELICPADGNKPADAVKWEVEAPRDTKFTGTGRRTIITTAQFRKI